MQGNFVILMRHSISIHRVQRYLASASQSLKCVNIKIKGSNFWNTQISGYTCFTSPHKDHQYNKSAQQSHLNTLQSCLKWN